MADSVTGPDWKSKNGDLIKEAVRGGEVRLSAQLTLATAADQKAAVLAGLFVAAATGVLGVVGLRPNSSDAVPLLVGASSCAIAFVAAAFTCIWATLPVKFWNPGNDPKEWFSDIESGRDLNSALVEQATHYDSHIRENRAVIKANATRFLRGAIVGIAAPIVGALAYAVAFISNDLPSKVPPLNLVRDGTLAAAVGLLITLVGALLTARGVILSDSHAAKIAGTKWDTNVDLRNAFLRQSRMARRGLWLIAGGTAVQLIALVQHAAR